MICIIWRAAVLFDTNVIYKCICYWDVLHFRLIVGLKLFNNKSTCSRAI